MEEQAESDRLQLRPLCRGSKTGENVGAPDHPAHGLLDDVLEEEGRVAALDIELRDRRELGLHDLVFLERQHVGERGDALAGVRPGLQALVEARRQAFGGGLHRLIRDQRLLLDEG